MAAAVITNLKSCTIKHTEPNRERIKIISNFEKSLFLNGFFSVERVLVVSMSALVSFSGYTFWCVVNFVSCLLFFPEKSIIKQKITRIVRSLRFKFSLAQCFFFLNFRYAKMFFLFICYFLFALFFCLHLIWHTTHSTLTHTNHINYFCLAQSAQQIRGTETRF